MPNTPPRTPLLFIPSLTSIYSPAIAFRFSYSLALLVLGEYYGRLATGLVSDLLLYPALGKFRSALLRILIDFHVW